MRRTIGLAGAAAALAASLASAPGALAAARVYGGSTGNGEPIGRSETYSSTAALENGIESVKTNAPAAAIVETGAA